MIHADITKEWVEAHFDYDAETGRLIHKPRGPIRTGEERHFDITLAGKPAGGVDANGFRVINIGQVGGKQRNVQASHLIWMLHKGAPPKGYIKRRDKDRSNDRIENLYDTREGKK